MRDGGRETRQAFRNVFDAADGHRGVIDEVGDVQGLSLGRAEHCVRGMDGRGVIDMIGDAPDRDAHRATGDREGGGGRRCDRIAIGHVVAVAVLYGDVGHRIGGRACDVGEGVGLLLKVVKAAERAVHGIQEGDRLSVGKTRKLRGRLERQAVVDLFRRGERHRKWATGDREGGGGRRCDLVVIGHVVAVAVLYRNAGHRIGGRPGNAGEGVALVLKILKEPQRAVHGIQEGDRLSVGKTRKLRGCLER